MSNHSNTKTDSSSKKELKVLFVASGNKEGGDVTSFVRSQYESLEDAGLEMFLLPVRGHGLVAYLKTIFKLRKVIRKEHPDVIHAHYAMCGYAIAIACFGMRHKPKKVVSILGSFPTRNRKWKTVRYMMKHHWDATIVKSQRTADQLELPVHIIPNGVNLKTFHVMDHNEACKNVGFVNGTKYVIWCSNPNRICKNWSLAVAGVKDLKGVELLAVYNHTPHEVAIYMNAADCLLLTSDSEGSPNVIKEAMACDCPIVTTDVGDVKERLIGLDGCYVVESREPKDIADAVEKALSFGKRTDGRKRIQDDKLEIKQIARRIMDVYAHL